MIEGQRPKRRRGRPRKVGGSQRLTQAPIRLEKATRLRFQAASRATALTYDALIWQLLAAGEIWIRLRRMLEAEPPEILPEFHDRVREIIARKQRLDADLADLTRAIVGASLATVRAELDAGPEAVAKAEAEPKADAADAADAPKVPAGHGGKGR